MTPFEIIKKNANSPGSAATRLSSQFDILRSESVFSNAVIRTYPPTGVESSKGDLFGMSFVVKDNIGVKSQPISFGIRPPVVELCAADAEPVGFFKSRGAALIASCNLDELALGADGENRYYGTIQIPFSPELPVGGSSGGCALCVARKWTDFAIASDSGGSARIPAAIAGISGLKLSADYFSKDCSLLLKDSIDCFALLAASPSDLALLINKTIATESCRLVSISSEDLNCLESSVRRNFEALLSKIERAHSVGSVSSRIPWAECLAVRKAVMANAVTAQICELSIPEELLSDEALALKVLTTSGDLDLTQNTKRRLEMAADASSLLVPGTYLITPTLPSEVVSRSSQSAGLPVNHFLAFANVCGLPALSFTVELPEPFSVQLVGCQGSEGSLLSLASSIQRVA